MYWAQALAGQTDDADLAGRFGPMAAAFEANEATIIEELNGAQGVAMDIGGYYRPDEDLAAKSMRPSETFNAALTAL